MKKYVWILVVCLCCALLFAGCGGCKHEWAAANCTTPKTCELCALTEGEAKGHIWEEATCLVPKQCATCHITEGAALGHTWEEATTEAPKTCTNCQTTEGSKLDVDSRFTTASTKELYGKWTCEIEMTGDLMGLPGYFESMPCTMYYEFGKTGELLATMEVHDEEAYIAEMKRFTIDLMYETFAAQGMDKQTADAAMVSTYGKTMEEYVDETVDGMEREELFSDMSSEMVYYVDGSMLYCGEDWDAEFGGSEYVLEDGVLTIDDDSLGQTVEFTKVEE